MAGRGGAARLSRNGAVVAAKVQATAVLIGAVIAGTCGVAGVGVQGYGAAEINKVKVMDLCRQAPDDCSVTTTQHVTTGG